MTMETTVEILQPLFTCLSCSIGFPAAEDQRIHYRSDHHRYNMKRRVAGLPPITATVFNEKVLLRRAETMVTTTSKGATCEDCNKVYTTENAYRSHLNSKRHKEIALKVSTRSRSLVHYPEGTSKSILSQKECDAKLAVVSSAITELSALTQAVSPVVPEDTVNAENEDELVQSIDAKIAMARSRLTPNSCLFCPYQAGSTEESIDHMTSQHSFFIPDVEYLVDLSGLLVYLGEKIAVGNVCLYCNGKGREYRTLEAVRKHMIDKAHCKLAYETDNDRLEVSHFYDFSSSYPDTGRRKAKHIPEEDEDWEDIDDDGENIDEVIEQDELSEEEDLPENEITYGDTEYELVLPSGARIGHRSLRRYYAQSLSSRPLRDEDPKSGAAVVRKLLGDKRSDLIPVKSGFGAFGAGTQVIKARNRGEAREAGRHIREFRDQKRKEEYKTRVAFVHNHQKHYRDPLLQ